MPIEIKMPALSPTMEEGTLAKWLVKEGDTVQSGDILAEIETDKATMEFETIDEGTVGKLLVAEGSSGVKVGTTIATILEDGEEAGMETDVKTEARAPEPAPVEADAAPKDAPGGTDAPAVDEKGAGTAAEEDAADMKEDAKRTDAPTHSAAPADAAPTAPADGRVKASPLARRLAESKGIDVGSVKGSGPKGRIVKADVEAQAANAAPAPDKAAAPVAEKKPAAPAAPAKSAPAPSGDPAEIPQEATKLSNMRKTIARRLTESKQQVPHIYLTVDIRLDPLLKLREQLNEGLAARGVKLSVNDLLIKAQAVALMEVPACNVMFAGDTLVQYKRADISVAVSIPGGLITPIVTGADAKGIAAIATEMKGLAERARAGKLQPHEYQGGTASLSNMGMFGIKHFDAVINPPQAMILAIGAGEKRPYVVGNAIEIATVMSVTGSFDHRAIDGADGAQFMAAFKRLVENPLAMLA